MHVIRQLLPMAKWKEPLVFRDDTRPFFYGWPQFHGALILAGLSLIPWGIAQLKPHPGHWFDLTTTIILCLFGAFSIVYALGLYFRLRPKTYRLFPTHLAMGTNIRKNCLRIKELESYGWSQKFGYPVVELLDFQQHLHVIPVPSEIHQRKLAAVLISNRVPLANSPPSPQIESRRIASARISANLEKYSQELIRYEKVEGRQVIVAVILLVLLSLVLARFLPVTASLIIVSTLLVGGMLHRIIFGILRRRRTARSLNLQCPICRQMPLHPQHLAIARRSHACPFCGAEYYD